MHQATIISGQGLSHLREKFSFFLQHQRLHQHTVTVTAVSSYTTLTASTVQFCLYHAETFSFLNCNSRKKTQYVLTVQVAKSHII
jgi:hypothetical protein